MFRWLLTLFRPRDHWPCRCNSCRGRARPRVLVRTTGFSVEIDAHPRRGVVDLPPYHAHQLARLIAQAADAAADNIAAAGRN
jgi:hypothetical protein